MKFPTVVIFTGLSTLGWISAAVPKPAMEAVPEAPAKPIDALIRDLADQDFKIREKATRTIWNIGEAALPALQGATESEDPEQAYRARDLVRKIELSITPETDPQVLALIERYGRASVNDKVNLLNKMAQKRAWRQILKLYATDKNPELRSKFQDDAKNFAVLAARECLLEGKPERARDFLEMAPADASGLMALAEFHRSQGTLDAELKRAKTLKGANSDAWQLALHRAAGNLESARDAATAAGETEISGVMSMLLGDPVPWLREDRAHNDDNPIHKAYTSLAIKRWQGKEIRPADMEGITRTLGSRDPSSRQNAINVLFLLGEAKQAEDALTKYSAFGAFGYFEAQERIPEALDALNLKPENPDFTTWVKTRIEHLSKDAADDEHEGSEETYQLAAMANFLERRGLTREADAAFIEPLNALAKKDVTTFTSFLGGLFGKRVGVYGSPLLAKRIGIAWAGEDPIRWAELVAAAFGEDEETRNLWDWLKELDPKASPSERLDAMLALCDIGSDPLKLREKWLNLAWEAVKLAPVEKQSVLYSRIFYAAAQNTRNHGNVAQTLRAWDQMSPDMRDDVSWDVVFLNLSAAGRWDEAGAYFLKLIDGMTKAKQGPRPDFYAYAAGCLRQAGKQADAAAFDARADQLALGNTDYAIQISTAYSFCRDYKRADEWRNRAIQECDPTSGGLFVPDEHDSLVIQMIADSLLERGQWKQAAAIYEVLAQSYSSVDKSGIQGALLLRQRALADMALALANLKSDRARSIAILEKCHHLIPADGSLADFFFPSLRKAGLKTEHDQWFDISWDAITAVIKRYPASDNTCNTAGWLASRARLKLDVAEDLMQNALSLNPEQSAYLDTMAEIQFAKGDRKKALEWSQLAINFWPQDPQLRRQHERFLSEPITH